MSLVEEQVAAVNEVLDGEIDEEVLRGDRWVEVRVFYPTRIPIADIESIRKIRDVSDLLFTCIDSKLHVRLCEKVNETHRTESIRLRHERESRPKMEDPTLPSKMNDIVHDLRNSFPCDPTTPVSSVIGVYTVEARIHPESSISYDDIVHFWHQYNKDGSVQLSIGLTQAGIADSVAVAPVAGPTTTTMGRAAHATEPRKYRARLTVFVQWRTPELDTMRKKRGRPQETDAKRHHG